MTKIRTRFAPSPTGYIHVGNLRTALMNYLIARKSGGSFILRLDDTDQERSKQEYADGIMSDLEWLGLHWDRVEKQSLRFDRYREAADDLRARGRFYECFETPVELDLKRKKQLNMHKPPVYDRASLGLSDEDKAKARAEGRAGYWRFLLNQNRIEWPDGILGPISIDAASVSDPVLIRADGQVLYTFASSVDDIDMGVTFIVRGADHVTNTATQIQIMEAMGGTPPNFAHHSLLTGAKGEELSKRLGTLSLRDLRASTGISYDERTQGTLQLFRTQKQVDAAEKDIAVLKADGVPFEVLNPEACVAAEPGLAASFDKIAGGLRLPGDETGDCFKFTNSLAEMAQAAGVTLGKDYPLPVVNHAEARETTLARYAVVKKIA